MKHLSRIALSLFALLSALSFNAAEFEYRLCADGRYWSDCPAALTDNASTGVTDSAATVNVTTDKGSGTLYCLTNQSVSETDLTVVAAGTAQAVSAAGEQSVSMTGLSPGTTYYTHCYHEYAGRPVAPMVGTPYIATTSFTTASGGTIYPMTQSIWNDRARTAPFAYTLPTQPVTSNTTVLNPGATAGDLQTAVQTDNARVEVNTDLTGISLTSWGTNVHLIVNDANTLSGVISFPGADIVRIEGGNWALTGLVDLAGSADITFMDVNMTITPPGQVGLAWQGFLTERIALVRSTFSSDNGSVNGAGFFSLQTTDYNNIFLLGCIFDSTSTTAVVRMQGNDQLIMLDNVMNWDAMSGSSGGAGVRIHDQSDDVWVADNLIVGDFRMNYNVGSEDRSPDVRNGFVEFNVLFNTAANGEAVIVHNPEVGNTGVANNNIVYDAGQFQAEGSPAAIGPFSGSNNITVWYTEFVSPGTLNIASWSGLVPGTAETDLPTILSIVGADH